MTTDLEALRSRIDTLTYRDEAAQVADAVARADLDIAARTRIAARATELVTAIRAQTRPGLMESFLAEYGLSTDEGVALMCLAEALLRVPDAETIDALIEDKIAPGEWSQHLGQSASAMVNASTWALMLTGRVLDDEKPGLAGTLRGALRRLGEPVIRAATGRAIKEMGSQFVLGETIKAAMQRARAQEASGYTYSYDMLGEAARTEADAARYFGAYRDAIAAIAKGAHADDVRANPGISVKLSALSPRYEEAQSDAARAALTPRLLTLARDAAAVGIGLNVDAEEAARLSLSLDLIEAVMRAPDLADWAGFGVVVQAYGRRASAVIDWLYAMAQAQQRRVMVRLVKGAYWDTEIKHSQVIGAPDFPVFTTKAATDVAYLACARQLLAMTDRIYPQFATHNAHSAAAILDMAGGPSLEWEFQRLHGMGTQLHDLLVEDQGVACRIYAPVGAHRDLLAYLVRRLLENGANSSFVNQIVDLDVPAAAVAADPFTQLGQPSPVRAPADIFLPSHAGARGWDLDHRPTLTALEAARAAHKSTRFQAEPMLALSNPPSDPAEPVVNPADPSDIVGEVRPASTACVTLAVNAAAPWDAPVDARARALSKAADLYEANAEKLFAILAREAGKTLPDAIGELREAADFLHYYGARAREDGGEPRGTIAAISPWNFPLAIFTGQIAGALAMGNAVIAKPAEETPLIAAAAVALLHEAGVPRAALQLLPGDGASLGAALTRAPGIDGIVFTGSTQTAQAIRRAMAETQDPGAPLIAETGGLNAMIVDSTALLEQAVSDVIASAFQSAGQRCSALRCLYVQEDIAEPFLTMLRGAMDALVLGDPWALSTDVGPVIRPGPQAKIAGYIAEAEQQGRLLHRIAAPAQGSFVTPAILDVAGIADLKEEVFGPVLHVARFRADDLDGVLADITASGYGLTFGLHTRIDDRVDAVTAALAVGNIYVNRNQIGAIVGSQPFGGEGLSGTGPKAGGPDYLSRFAAPARPSQAAGVPAGSVDLAALQSRVDAVARNLMPVDASSLPGPTGESNRLSRFARPPLLCLGPGQAIAEAQADAVTALGGQAVAVPEAVAAVLLRDVAGIGGVLWWGEAESARAYAIALADRDGAILPLITAAPIAADALLERHVCIDTTAAGGNADLLASVSETPSAA
ncbi:MAG: bifunctional proline dehydrogenase/L-glutamate gamma-semialdehyde dehydrogenase PutA [Pseudomonadota bacterium]